MKQERFRLVIQVPASWMELVDRHRGKKSRSEYLRGTIHRSLSKCESGVERRKDNRGLYDRVSRGLASPETALKIRRRERHAQVMREWRAAHPDAPKQTKKAEAVLPPPPPVFVFHDNGIVGSPDLDVQATFCGLVREDGKYQAETTRYPEAVIRDAVRQALNTGSLSGERWRRFVARGERG